MFNMQDHTARNSSFANSSLTYNNHSMVNMISNIKGKKTLSSINKAISLKVTLQK